MRSGERRGAVESGDSDEGTRAAKEMTKEGASSAINPPYVKLHKSNSTRLNLLCIAALLAPHGLLTAARAIRPYNPLALAQGAARPYFYWDTEWYASIADEGYKAPAQAAFMPAEPALYRLCGRPWGVVVWTLAARGVSALAFRAVAGDTRTRAAIRKHSGGGQEEEKERTQMVVDLATLIYCFNPASVFFAVPYTESPFALVSLLVTLLWLRGSLGAAAAVSAAAPLIRSNGIVLAGYGAYELLRRLLGRTDGQQREIPVTERKNRSRILKFRRPAIGPIAMITVPIVAYVATNKWIRDRICSDGSVKWEGISSACQEHPWSLYSHVQATYWNVGFLQYWKMDNTVRFLLTIPVLTAVLVLCFVALKNPIIQALDLLQKLRFRGVLSVAGDLDVVQVFAVHSLCLTAMVMLWANFEILPRVLFSSSPFLPIALANWACDHPGAKYLIFWVCGVYTIAGCLLFGSSYPWT